MPGYDQYQDEVKEDISVVLGQLQCQPILFVGSGFSLRYGNGPTWATLLAELAKDCPLIDKDFPYYKQKYDNDLAVVASSFVEPYFEWAWSTDGKERFPSELFSENTPRDAYLKFAAAKRLRNLSAQGIDEALRAELDALKELGSHAVITTNYDELLEPLFPNYEVVIGQNVFRQSALVVGEIFKIHGLYELSISPTVRP